MSELNEFSRAELLLGKKGIEKLRKARVAVFGIGGVGSFAAEALARGGVGHLALVDGDVVSLTNINRQLIATQKTIGRRKTSVMADEFMRSCRRPRWWNILWFTVRKTGICWILLRMIILWMRLIR